MFSARCGIINELSLNVVRDYTAVRWQLEVTHSINELIAQGDPCELTN